MTVGGPAAPEALTSAREHRSFLAEVSASGCKSCPYIFGRAKTHSLLRQLSDDLPGQRAFMDLVRSIDQVKCAAMRPHRGQREIVANASTTEDLDGTIDDIGEHGRRDDLNHCDFFLGSFFAQRIDHPCRFEGQEAGLFDLQLRLGDPVLDDALLCQRPAKGYT